MRHQGWLLGLAAAVWALFGQSVHARDWPLVESYLHTGRLAEGEEAFLTHLKAKPGDDQARFGLGALQFVRAVEHLGQSLYRYGLRRELGRELDIPFLRLPIPLNPSPEKCTYGAVRKIGQMFVNDLRKAEETLAVVRDKQVRLPLRLAAVRLDLVGDRKAGQPLSAILQHYFGGRTALPADAELLVVFDRGDVAWLRGYCHLLMALAEVGLAHDGRELFDCAGHVFFERVETTHEFLFHLSPSKTDFFAVGDVDIVDLIAAIHLIRLPVCEPARMKSALEHLRMMCRMSKESWKFILAETDDDHEWIPNPRQKGALGIPIRQEQIDSWLAFIDEFEALLAGKRLIPFWRGSEKRGVNLLRVFSEPRTLDLVLWVQGTAATPYLEKGKLTNKEVWQNLTRVFGGNFIGMAIWFN